MDIIDFHAHVLPRADHGSSSTEVSMSQLKMAKSNGISKIIATPHFYPYREDADRFLERRSASFERLRAHLTEEHPKIKLGAEILICDNIEEMPSLDSLCIEGTKALLIELPFNDFFDSFVTSVNLLVKSGYIVILAHAERYNPEDINRLVAVGARIQLNAEALCGLFIPKHIREWLKENRVVAIGSDIHGTDKKAYARYKKAVKRLGAYTSFINDFSNSLWNR